MEAESTQTTETYLKLAAWVHANRKVLIIGAGVAAAVAIAIGVVTWQKNAAETNADQSLMSQPLVVVEGNRITPAPASSFLDMAKEHADTAAGGYAELLGAKALFLDGKYPEAHQEFSKFIESNPDSPLMAQAKVGLAACLEAEGKFQEAAQQYQEIIVSYPTEASVVSPAKLTLARLDEQLNRPEQALSYYEDLARINNPYDPWAAEARERGAILLAKHPELRKPPPGATSGPVAVPQSTAPSLFPPAQTPSTPAPSPAKP